MNIASINGMQKIELQLIALANSESHPGNFAVILKEVGGNRRLPIIIGGFEAQAIAVAIEQIQPNRPLTHDLLKNTMIELGAELEEVMITELLEGVFHARLVCNQDTEERIEIDARSSDAIAMAVRFGCPIYVDIDVMDEAGIIIEEKGKIAATPKAKSGKNPSLDQYPLDELETMLEKFIAKEDYEKAAKIRDAIERKRGEN